MTDSTKRIKLCYFTYFIFLKRFCVKTEKPFSLPQTFQVQCFLHSPQKCQSCERRWVFLDSGGRFSSQPPHSPWRDAPHRSPPQPDRQIHRPQSLHFNKNLCNMIWLWYKCFTLSYMIFLGYFWLFPSL